MITILLQSQDASKRFMKNGVHRDVSIHVKPWSLRGKTFTDLARTVDMITTYRSSLMYKASIYHVEQTTGYTGSV